MCQVNEIEYLFHYWDIILIDWLFMCHVPKFLNDKKSIGSQLDFIFYMCMLRQCSDICEPISIIVFLLKWGTSVLALLKFALSRANGSTDRGVKLGYESELLDFTPIVKNLAT